TFRGTTNNHFICHFSTSGCKWVWPKSSRKAGPVRPLPRFNRGGSAGLLPFGRRREAVAAVYPDRIGAAPRSHGALACWQRRHPKSAALSTHTFRAAASHGRGRPPKGDGIHQTSSYPRRVRCGEAKLRGITTVSWTGG